VVKKFLISFGMLAAVFVAAADQPNAADLPVKLFLLAGQSNMDGNGTGSESGFGDFHPFGTPDYPTPNVAKLAEEGMRLNQFYVPQAICSASRSALLSACNPGRTRMFGAHGPKGKGLSPKFATMAEVFKKDGYATAHFGKWHCGDTEETRPLARGFDEHAGLMYSNDMWRFHPSNPLEGSDKGWGRHPLQYWENGKVTIESVNKKDQTQLTTWSTDYSVKFIEEQAKKPFFLYLAHSMPHVPLFCSDKFLGKSGVGLYGDVIMEIDWSVGQVMAALKKAGVEKNTIVIFSSDNGPWTEYGKRAGVTPYRGHKHTSFDGGIRSATIIKYPPQITGGAVLDRAIGSIDLLPTLAHLTGSSLPENEIDGKNVWPVITGDPDTKNPQAYYPFTNSSHFEGIISGDGKWKLHLPHRYCNGHVSERDDGKPNRSNKNTLLELSLFDMQNDPFETTNVVDTHPEVAKEMQALADAHAEKFFPSKKKK
jgi:arylsulfatase A